MNPLKFRCYRCNQLLGVSRQKVGEVVACPRCQAELVVPDPDEPDAPQASEEAAATAGSSLLSPSPQLDQPPPAAPGDSDTGLPLDVLNLRPEDIGVEPGVSQTPRTNAPPAPRAATVVLSAEEVPPVGPGPDLGPQPAPPAPVVTDSPATAGDALTIPSISIDGPTRKTRQQGPVTMRSRDLILPRSVVASWSLFVLLALGFSFFAGLLAGHYVWRVH